MDLTTLLLGAPVLLFSFVAHEYAHGYAALRQGDTTAYQLGRLTLNPLPHIDPMMTVILPLASFFFGGIIIGGAKPVPITPGNFRHYKRGDIIVSLAGVTTNVLIGIVCALLIPPLRVLGDAVPALASSCAIVQHMAVFGVQLNFFLAAFNLLPIPPLDGSHVAKYLLPPAWALQYQQLGRYGLLLLFAFVAFGQPLLAAWLRPALLASQTALGVVGPYVLPAPWR